MGGIEPAGEPDWGEVAEQLWAQLPYRPSRECPTCGGNGHGPGRVGKCATCRGMGLVYSPEQVEEGIATLGLPIGLLDYGTIANLEFVLYGRNFPCKGAECSCPARCLVHPQGVTQDWSLDYTARGAGWRDWAREQELAHGERGRRHAQRVRAEKERERRAQAAEQGELE